MVLVAAALAVIGTLAAAVVTQVLSGRRESRQWKRQQRQELARWERERAERQEQWDREDHARWQQERLTSYSELIQQLDRFRTAISIRLPVDGPGPKRLDAEWRGEVAQLFNHLGLVRAKARLFTSTETDRICGDAFVRATVCWNAFNGGSLQNEERIRILRSNLWDLGARSADLLRAIRRELGLDVDA